MTPFHPVCIPGRFHSCAVTVSRKWCQFSPCGVLMFTDHDRRWKANELTMMLECVRIFLTNLSPGLRCAVERNLNTPAAIRPIPTGPLCLSRRVLFAHLRPHLIPYSRQLELPRASQSYFPFPARFSCSPKPQRHPRQVTDTPFHLIPLPVVRNS